MKVPVFLDEPVVDKEGKLTDIWRHILRQLLQQLQLRLSDDGYIMPQQPTSNLPTLETERSIGSIVYDSDTDEFKAAIKKVVGPTVTSEFKTIQLA